MSWQEGLRELDEELASGRISADEYRVRRDQLLTSAVTSSDDPAANRVPPAAPPPGQVSDEADRTQEVRGWQAVRPGADVDQTQVVPGVPTQSGIGGQPPRPAPANYPGQYGQPAWQQDEAPPWGGQEFPPLVPTGNPDWIRQGPEVFEAEGGSRSTRILLTTLAVVVVVGMVIGSYFLFFNDKGDPEAQTDPPATQSRPASTTPPEPKDDLSTAELPGEAEDHSDITTFADAEASEFLTADEIAVYKEAEAGKSRLVAATTDGKVHTLIFTTQATSPNAAETASGKLAEQQLIYGMTEYPDAPANVYVAEFAGNDKTPAIIRAHYQHKSTIVRIQVNGDDLDAVTVVFEDLVAAQLEVLDAND